MARYFKDYKETGYATYQPEEEGSEPIRVSVANAQIEGDTTADLINLIPEETLPENYPYPGVFFTPPTTMHIIEDNTTYAMKSDGTWVLQEDPLFSGIYTKSEIDDMISDIDDIQTAQAVSIRDLEYDVEALQTADNATNGRIAKMADQGAKNLLNVYDTQTQTINGITWTINADGTVTANGTATANSFLYLIPNNTNIAYGYETHISGCPAGGSSTTYEIQVAMTGGTTYHDYGDGQVIPSTYVYRYFVCAVRSGQTVTNLVFQPMLTESWKYALSQAFVPYSPTNAELAKMILSQ